MASNCSVAQRPQETNSRSFYDFKLDTTCERTWRITEFTKKMEMKKKEELFSNLYCLPTDGITTDLQLMIHPNDECDKEKDMVSLHLIGKNPGKSRTCVLRVGLVSNSGETSFLANRSVTA